MCAWCGKRLPGIRDDSHGICGSCRKKILSELKQIEETRTK